MNPQSRWSQGTGHWRTQGRSDRHSTIDFPRPEVASVGHRAREDREVRTSIAAVVSAGCHERPAACYSSRRGLDESATVAVVRACPNAALGLAFAYRNRAVKGEAERLGINLEFVPVGTRAHCHLWTSGLFEASNKGPRRRPKGT
jgi:hypothetical protein